MSVLLLKKSLLLTHGTIYGAVAVGPVVVQAADVTDSIERHNYPGFDWDADTPYLEAFPTSQLGTVTDNAPVDVISWAAGGNQPYDTMAPWRGCLVLLERM